MKLLLISLFISAICYGQKDSLPKKPDSTVIVMSQFLIFLQDKVTVKDYMPVQKMVDAFLKQEFLKPRKK